MTSSLSFHLLKNSSAQRLFLVKTVKTSSQSTTESVKWVIEFDEINEALYPFKGERADLTHFGFIESIKGNHVFIKTSDGTMDYDFSDKMVWILNTLMVSKEKWLEIDSVIYPMLEIPRDKYKDDKKMVASEIALFKLKAEMAPGKHKKPSSAAFADNHMQQKMDLDEDEERVSRKKRGNGKR